MSIVDTIEKPGTISAGSVAELRDITAGYGSTTVLHGISMAIAPRSIVALLGPNGAGKTTLLNTFGGLIRPSGGQILLDDEDVTGLRPAARSAKGACLIPEGRGVFPNLSVRENLLLQAAGRHDAIEIAVDVFPALRHRLRERAGNLSGGQQQMLALARCFTTSPALVMLDEVSMGLAPLIVDQIFEAIGRLARSGVSLLLVEQYVTRALTLADDVYLIDRGRITFHGAPDQVDEDDLMQQYLHIPHQ